MSITKLFARYLKYSVGIMPRKLKFYLPKNYEAKKVYHKNPECQLIISVPFEVHESTPTTSFVSLKQNSRTVVFGKWYSMQHANETIIQHI